MTEWPGLACPLTQGSIRHEKRLREVTCPLCQLRAADWGNGRGIPAPFVRPQPPASRTVSVSGGLSGLIWCEFGSSFIKSTHQASWRKLDSNRTNRFSVWTPPTVFQCSNCIFKHTQTILKALLSDIVPGYERPYVMGRFCAASSVGFILGPILSGYLVELDGGFYTTCFICCFIFFVNAGVVWWLPYKEWFYVPTQELHLMTETNCESTCTSLCKEENRKHLDRASNGVMKHKTSDPLWSQCISVGQKIKGLICSNLWDIFLVRFLMALANLLYFSNFVLAIEERFSVPPSLIGYLISYGGIIGTLSGCIAGSVARLYNNKTLLLLLHSSILTSCTMAVYSFATSIQIVVLCTTVLGFSTTIGRMCVTDVELSRIEKQARGTLIGAGQSVTAVARILAPLLSGLIQEVSVCGPPRLGAVLALLAILLMISICSKLCKTTEAKVKLQ
ncbi:major facilitator superfamily domain-containing protein 9 isoform X2 [Pristis pectinata]|uniref:major facilitator superfamily domain-containing protein 9 isoform X2 n=1 Tax=Pristis pectinata TaxID=685728 RepID=UPI00223CF3C2|nr:major facilitator superfamily domain-containing protein 9 isoform X2 [Pristis pectinata]